MMKKTTTILSMIMALAMGISVFALAACEPTDTSGSGSTSTSAPTSASDSTSMSTPTSETEHQHTYADEWMKDETYHWHAATCEHSTLVSDKAEHNTDGEDDACTVCGYVPVHEHTYDAKYWSVNSTWHWRAATCKHYTLKAEEGDHTFGDDGKCTVCGYIPHEDTYKYEYSATQHWQRVVCSIKDTFKSCDKGYNENVPKNKNIADHTFNDNHICTVCGFNGTWQNYNDDCILCETCGGCIKTECVHSSEEGHKFCGDIENAKTYEFEAEEGEVFSSDGATVDILDYTNGNRGCIHISYANVKYTITVSKACTVTLKLRNGSTGNFAEKGTVFVNGEEFATKAVLAQPKSSDVKCSFVWNTLGCIKLQEGVNEIEIYQYKGGYEFHLDKMALITEADVDITWTPIDNTKNYQINGYEPMVKDEYFDKPAAELATIKFNA